MGSEGGCMALAPYLGMVVWPRKFRPHLLEKYDGSVNPAEFLHIYSNSILAAGENEVIMANYFLVALTGTAWSWFMANFKSVYTRLGNEADLHSVQQRPGESQRSFI
jgi:hypothetical protein